MKKLLVRYRGWGENWPLGELADNGDDLLFEYSKEALSEALELSPLRLPLRSEAYGDNPRHLFRLPGLISDALPDGWGLLLMDRYFRRLGLEIRLCGFLLRRPSGHRQSAPAYPGGFDTLPRHHR